VYVVLGTAVGSVQSGGGSAPRSLSLSLVCL